MFEDTPVARAFREWYKTLGLGEIIPDGLIEQLFWEAFKTGYRQPR